jgi:hypothetical protein
MDDSDGEATTDGQCEWKYEGGVRCEHEALVDDVLCVKHRGEVEKLRVQLFGSGKE